MAAGRPLPRRVRTRSGQLGRGHEEERVARALAPVLVLDHRLYHPGNPLHRPVRVHAGPHGDDGGGRSDEEEAGGGGRGEAHPSGQGEPAEHGPRDQERDREVDDDGMVRGQVGHSVAPL